MTTIEPSKKVISHSELEALFGISRTTVWNWRRRKVLPEPSFYMGVKPYWHIDDLPQVFRTQPE